MEKKELKRGYVKWEDENGFHKEPAYLHPDMLENASDVEKIDAENVRVLNGGNAIQEKPFTKELPIIKK